MKKLFLGNLILSFGLFFTGCVATSLPMRSSLNDFVTMGTKTNSLEKIQFLYESKLVDGLTKPFERDKAKELTGHLGFNHSESETLGKMIKEYMGNKFTNVAENGDTKIKFVLTDFWLEQYSTDSGTSQTLAALGGGEINVICVAKVKGLLTINRKGEEISKIFSGTAEDTFVQGFGTGTQTSNLNRGKDSIEHVHANNINIANNKIVMMINSHFQEIGL